MTGIEMFLLVVMIVQQLEILFLVWYCRQLHTKVNGLTETCINYITSLTNIVAERLSND